MSRPATAVVLATTAVVLPLAGCGAGSKASSAGGSTASASGTSAPSAPTTSPPQTSSATGSIPSNNGAATAFLPATFVASADGSLSPPMVAAPAATTILFSITSHAPHPLRITIAGHTLNVTAGGRTSARIAGLKPARYSVAVNGTPRAVIVVGAQPGP